MELLFGDSPDLAVLCSRQAGHVCGAVLSAQVSPSTLYVARHLLSPCTGSHGAVSVRQGLPGQAGPALCSSGGHSMDWPWLGLSSGSWALLPVRTGGKGLSRHLSIWGRERRLRHGHARKGGGGRWRGDGARREQSRRSPLVLGLWSHAHYHVTSSAADARDKAGQNPRGLAPPRSPGRSG